MRKWVRSPGDVICGGSRCGGVVIRLGEPMQIVLIAGVKRELRRCPMCAEGEAPPDLPPFIQEAPVPVLSGWSRFGRDLPIDVKQRASGE